MMKIRRAQKHDKPMITELLNQVLMVHHTGRPDLFKSNTRKYTDDELDVIIYDDKTPVFVAVDDSDKVMGYAFCISRQAVNDNILTDIKTLYIDDLCVDQNIRGRHVGKSLYEYVIDYARENGYYNVTLNVWSCNENAMRFYEKMGLVPQKIGMETIL